MGRVGRFVLGAVLIGASFLIPGSTAFLIGIRAAMLSTGISFSSGAVFEALAGTTKRQSAIEVNNPDNQAPLPVVYGEAKLGLRLADMRVGGSGNKFLYIVGALCHGSSDGLGIQAIDEIYFDDDLAINAAGTIQSRWTGKLAFAKYLGTDAQSVDPTMTAAFATAWPSTSKGRGVAYVMLRLEADDEVFPTGIPNVTCIVRGAKVQDTRVGGANVYSTNPALALYDYLTSLRYGLECPTGELDTTSINTFANYYDEVITKDGANTGKRFEINGWIDVGQSVQDNVRSILTSCRGNLIFEGGKYRLFTRRVVTPTTFKLTEANIVGGWRFRTLGITEAPNIIRYTFIDPGTTDTFAAETKYWPRPGLTNTYLTDDNNYEVIADVELPMTTDKYTAEQIALVSLKEARSGIVVELTAMESALQLQIGDLTPITHTTPAWVDKNFWIMGMMLLPTGHVRIVAVEYDANAYTLDAQTTFPARPATSLPNPFSSAGPGTLTLLAGDDEARSDKDSVTKPFIKASWVASTDPYLSYYEVQYKKTSDATWIAAGLPTKADLSIEIGPVIETVSYEVRVRTVNTIGVPSAWVQDNVTPNLQIVRVGSAWLDDMSTPLLPSVSPEFGPCFGRRWRNRSVSVGGSGAGTLEQVQCQDALVSSHVMRITGPMWLEYTDSIPIDPNLLYVMRIRVRQLKDPVSGIKPHFLGVSVVRQGEPGFTTGQTYVNQEGANFLDTQHYVLAQEISLAQSSVWTDYYAYMKGFYGTDVPLSSGMLTNSGLTAYVGAEVQDGDLQNVFFGTDSAVSGAFLRIDFGVGVTRRLSELWLYCFAAGSTAQWTVEWCDTSGGVYTAVATGVVFNKNGWNRIGFARPAAGHRFWKLRLTNTPGAGPEFAEMRVTDFTESLELASTILNPAKFAPGATHFRPMIICNWSIPTPGLGGIFEVDFMYATLPAGFVPDLATDEVARRNDTLYDEDGLLLPGVNQNDGTGDSRGLVKGIQKGTCWDQAVITFDPVFQTVPVVDVRGGLTYQPNAAFWVGAFNAANAQHEVLKALDLTVSGFTTMMRLAQYGATTPQNIQCANPPTLITTPGGVDSVGLLAAGANDDKYWFYVQLRYRHRSTNGLGGKSYIKYALDSSADGGANYTERYSNELALDTGGNVAFSTTNLNPISSFFAGGLSNVAPADRIRVRLISFRTDANVELDTTLSGARFRNAATDGVPGSITYTTAADVICAKTPNTAPGGPANSDAGSYQAAGWV